MNFKLQSFLDKAGKEMCLAADYCFIVANYLGATDDKVISAIIIQTLVECYDTPILTNDFYVKDPVSLMKVAARLCGYQIKCNVEKKDITSYKDLPEKGYAAVRHDYGDKSHFVVAKDRQQVWDSLEYSNCMIYGSPTSARIVSIEVIK